MSLIITATDFSKVATNAVNYACELAKETKSDIIVFHSYYLPIYFSDLAIPQMSYNLVEDLAKDNMKELITQLSNKYPEIKIKGEILYGDIIESLEELLQKENTPWLIVLGNHNAEENIDWLDSTLIQAFRNLKNPVIAIPSEVKYKTVNKLCFAFDNKHEGNDTAFAQINEISKKLNAELHVIFSETDVLNRDNQPDFDPKIKSILEISKPHYHIFFDGNIENTLSDFLKKEEMDWVIIMPRKHSFLESLFHKSHTKSISKIIHIPILAVHEDV